MIAIYTNLSRFRFTRIIVARVIFYYDNDINYWKTRASLLQLLAVTCD